MARRQVATRKELDSALGALDKRAQRISAADWPGDLKRLELPGLYAWWVDSEGARDLGEGLGTSVRAGRIYAGQTGATKWPSGKTGSATLEGRIGRNHLRGRVRGSTFRLTLAASLKSSLGLTVEGPTQLAPSSESELSNWMRSHLEVAVHPVAERDVILDLEKSVLGALDPPLNLGGRANTPLRLRLADLRAELAVVGDVPEKTPPRLPGASRDASISPQMAPSEITLHDELITILDENPGDWLTTAELAAEVNRRGRYRKRDGSDVDAFQIHGRTKNYPHLFLRDGARVRRRSA